ncbi:MAG TPA: hypothetical protein VFN97_24515 [Actinospica sp.]|nr:hypothetical protein [Actinospica sp.]
MRIPLLAATALAAALPLLLAGCSPSAPGAAADASGSAAAGSADPDAGLLTGARLATALVTTGIPAGYAASGSGTENSGSDFQTPSDPATAGPKCANLEATGWVNLAGYGSASFAQNDYVNNGSSEEFAQEIDAYQGTTAQAVMAALAKLGTACPSFSDSGTKSTVKVAVATGASLGDGTVTITLTDPSWSSSETLVAVRVGTNVVTVLNSATGDSAAYANSLAGAITANVKKLG